MARTSAARKHPIASPSPTPDPTPDAVPASADEARPRPFVKWAGGKRQLLEQLRPLLPTRFGRYFEPFAGGAALFFPLGRKNAVLADMNAELIDVYLAVRDEVDAVIEALRGYRYGEAHYYRAREADPG